MPLTLRERTPTSLPIEVSGIRPDRLRECSVAEIEQEPILVGNETVPLAEIFAISGTANEDLTHVWDGSLSHVKGLGAGLTLGQVRVTGSAGMHAGARLNGGEVVIEGDAGDWAGAEMRGGLLTILGNAGDSLAGAYRGQTRGMTGGEVIVYGNCGHEAGHSLRRGLVAVRGSAGDGLGFGLLAGTIVVGGAVGAMVGAGMKRGTLLLRQAPARWLPSFRPSGVAELVIIRLLVRRLAELGLPEFLDLQDRPLKRYLGDFVELGRGEILVAGD